MVIPEWPPSTGTVVVVDTSGVPLASATKVEARTMSRVVTPKILSEARRQYKVRQTEYQGGPFGDVDSPSEGRTSWDCRRRAS